MSKNKFLLFSTLPPYSQYTLKPATVFCKAPHVDSTFPVAQTLESSLTPSPTPDLLESSKYAKLCHTSVQNLPEASYLPLKKSDGICNGNKTLWHDAPLPSDPLLRSHPPSPMDLLSPEFSASAFQKTIFSKKHKLSSTDITNALFIWSYLSSTFFLRHFDICFSERS